VWLAGLTKHFGLLSRRLKEHDPHHREVVLELPGHGTSPVLLGDSPTLAQVVDQLARELHRQLEALGSSGRLTVVGHSMGARVAMLFRTVAPHFRADELVLLDMTPAPLAHHTGGVKWTLAQLAEYPSSSSSAEAAEALGALARRVGQPAGALSWLQEFLTQEPSATGATSRLRWQTSPTAMPTLVEDAFAQDLRDEVARWTNAGTRVHFIRAEDSIFSPTIRWTRCAPPARP
jgi:pimeloyl-ACP methyl ester carboxylesterase